MRKIFLVIFLPVAILVGGIVAVIYQTETESNLAITEAKESGYLNLQLKTTTDTFRYIVTDLMFLAEEQRELQKRLDVRVYSGEGLAEDYLMFAMRKGLYDQIRFIDEKGMEIVRVNYNKGDPVVVPAEELQNKGDRYYFKEAILLEEGEIYVSPFDLNIENKKIESPLKPMIRIATPVFDSAGERRGIVIVNFLGEKLLGSLRDIAANAEGDPMLLNQDGYWLLGPEPEDEWGFMYKDRKERSFRKNFPEEWKAISGGRSGQFTTANGLYTFVRVYPLEEITKASIIKAFIKAGKGPDTGNYYWTIVSHVPPERLYLVSLELRKKLLELYVVLLLIAAVGTWLIARANHRRKETEYMLKRRSREIEELNITLEKRVRDELAKSREKDYMLIQQSRLAAMGEMIGHIAHQWRQPLNLLGLLLINIKDDFKHDELDKTALDNYTLKAGKLIDKMSATIDDFRNFFNPNKEKEEFSPAKAIEEAFKLIEDSFKDEKITVTIEEETDVIVQGYPNEYSQVILNLINNAKDAIKDTEEKEGTIMIKIGRDDGNCIVTLTDNGGGIPEEIIEKIFDPYFSSKKEGGGGGTGLGLYMSKMIIEDNMDGRIEVSNVNGGARFKVLLPVNSDASL